MFCVFSRGSQILPTQSESPIDLILVRMLLSLQARVMGGPHLPSLNPDRLKYRLWGATKQQSGDCRNVVQDPQVYVVCWDPSPSKGTSETQTCAKPQSNCTDASLDSQNHSPKGPLRLPGESGRCSARVHRPEEGTICKGHLPLTGSSDLERPFSSKS